MRPAPASLVEYADGENDGSRLPSSDSFSAGVPHTPTPLSSSNRSTAQASPNRPVLRDHKILVWMVDVAWEWSRELSPYPGSVIPESRTKQSLKRYERNQTTAETTCLTGKCPLPINSRTTKTKCGSWGNRQAGRAFERSEWRASSDGRVLARNSHQHLAPPRDLGTRRWILCHYWFSSCTRIN